MSQMMKAMRMIRVPLMGSCDEHLVLMYLADIFVHELMASCNVFKGQVINKQSKR